VPIQPICGAENEWRGGWHIGCNEYRERGPRPYPHGLMQYARSYGVGGSRVVRAATQLGELEPFSGLHQRGAMLSVLREVSCELLAVQGHHVFDVFHRSSENPTPELEEMVVNLALRRLLVSPFDWPQVQ